jgi:integrase/recombinase XerD
MWISSTAWCTSVPGKQKKQREVPLHPSTVTALREYARLRDARFPEPATPAFFIGARGRRVPRGELNRTFTQLVREVGLDGCGARARPRPHDLRHALAVRTLLDWFEAGENIDRRMPLLSAFLGHVDPASTFWYLEAVPELLQLISRRLEQLPEVLP